MHKFLRVSVCSIWECLVWATELLSLYGAGEEGRKAEGRACREKIGRGWQVISDNWEGKTFFFSYLCRAYSLLLNSYQAACHKWSIRWAPHCPISIFLPVFEGQR